MLNSSCRLAYNSYYINNATYGIRGQPLTIRYTNGLTTTYDYDDGAGEAFSARLQHLTVSNDRLDLTYRYDAVGNVTQLQDRSAAISETLTFTYDSLDRLTQAVTSGSGQTPYNESYNYNTIGNLTAKAGVNYTYPASGASSVQPHAVRRVNGSGGTSKAIGIRAYSTPCGSSSGTRATMELWVNGSKIQTWTNIASSWTVYSQATLLSGNDQIDIVFTNDCNSGGYDRNLYVDYVTVNGTTIQAEGGATVLDQGAGSAAFDGRDVIAGQQTLAGNGALRFVVGPQAYAACYDANGNMTCRLMNGKAYLHTYNEENRLWMVNDRGTGQTTTFTYDGDGGLIKKTVGVTTTYYAGSHFEKTASPEVVTKYYTFGGQRVALRVCNGSNGSCGTNGATSTLTYLHADHLGSASLATNSSGGVVSSMRYTAYGLARPGGTMTTDRRFTGQRYEAGLGLYDYNARFYDPLLGRFISADTLVPDFTNPQSFNRYAYVLNNPLKYTDPTGHKECERFCEGEKTDDRTIGSEYAGEWDPAEQARNRAILEMIASLGDTVLAVLLEPYDWVSTGARCMQGECNLLDYAGFLPLIPGALGRVDDVARTANKIENTADGLGVVSKPTVLDQKLQQIIEYAYRPGAKIGSGSTADAIRHTKMTGELVEDSNHIDKGKDLVRMLKTWLKRAANSYSHSPSPEDITAAQTILDDLLNALGQ